MLSLQGEELSTCLSLMLLAVAMVATALEDKLPSGAVLDDSASLNETDIVASNDKSPD